VGQAIESGQFTWSPQLQHTHEGSIGQLCNKEIAAMMQQAVGQFEFDKVTAALNALLQ
jgi:argininosuccinate lyase